MGALVSALPDIIAKVAEAKGVPVPAPLAQLPTDDLAGKFAPAHSTRRDPVWPRFPAVTTYLSGAAAEPLQLKAPVSTFTPITRVEALMDQGFSPSSRSRAQVPRGEENTGFYSRYFLENRRNETDSRSVSVQQSDHGETFLSWSSTPFPPTRMSSTITAHGYAANICSFALWKTSVAVLMPKGILRNLNLPKGVANVVRRDE
ncbi:hypothetical protein GOODEAATRI_033061, partial [Goodea atripinnis]